MPPPLAFQEIFDGPIKTSCQPVVRFGKLHRPIRTLCATAELATKLPASSLLRASELAGNFVANSAVAHNVRIGRCSLPKRTTGWQDVFMGPSKISWNASGGGITIHSMVRNRVRILLDDRMHPRACLTKRICTVSSIGSN